MSRKAPGRAYREGLTLVEMFEMFPSEEAATVWFEDAVWPQGRHCPHCGNAETKETKNRKPMPYWCGGCRSYFSVRTGTPMQRSKIPLRKWAIAIYLVLTSLKSVSSMKLHRDLGISQVSAWFMLHRIREAWGEDDDDQFDGPVEVDETYMGGKRKNMSNAKRKALREAGIGRGTVGRTIVVGMKDRDSNEVRAEVIADTTKPTLQAFVRENAKAGATLYTDEHGSYTSMPAYDHQAVNHSVSEYVRGMAHTNGMESFWAALKRAQDGTFHKMSPKHLQRYVSEFAAKHNIRDLGTLAQMRDTVARLVGHRLLYWDLVAPNGLSNAARP